MVYESRVSPAEFYCSPAERGELKKQAKPQTNEQLAPHSFLPWGGVDGEEKGAGGGGTGGGRRETE